MKRVEMYGGQRDLIAAIIAKAEQGQAAVIIPPSLIEQLQGLVDAYDAAQHEHLASRP